MYVLNNNKDREEVYFVLSSDKSHGFSQFDWNKQCILRELSSLLLTIHSKKVIKMQDIFILDKIIENNNWVGCTVKNMTNGVILKVNADEIKQAFHQQRLINAVVVNNKYIMTKVGYDSITEKIENYIILYHASTEEVSKPEWDHVLKQSDETETSSDFGVGFYLSTDTEQPIKLVCGKGKVVLNRYKVDLTGLSIMNFDLSDDWLLTVAFHRRDFKRKKEIHAIRDQYRDALKKYDVVIGPIADDRMFTTMQLFISSALTNEVAKKCMDIMGYSKQYTFKSKKACNRLNFIGSKTLTESEIKVYQYKVLDDQEEMQSKIEQIRIENHAKGELFAEMLKKWG
jgi:hypothetical protein